MPAQCAVGYGKVEAVAEPETEGIGVRPGVRAGAVNTTKIKAVGTVGTGSVSTAGAGAEGMGQKSVYFLPA
ncbi:Zinc finger BED domain-containing protein [Dirofilaria immitis]